MASATFEDLFKAPFIFNVRSSPITCELRPVWRLHVLMLILDKCYGGKASMEQLHVLNWAVRTTKTRKAFLEFLDGKRTPSQIIVRYDPSLNRAVHFAFAEGLVMRRDVQLPLTNEHSISSPPYRVILSKKGRDLLKHIYSMDDCFTELKRFFNRIPQKVTLKQIDMLFSWGANL